MGAHALNLVTGYAGQVSLGHAGLMAAGAFTAGILSEELGAPFWLALPAAVLVGALLGVVVGIPSLRLRGLYLALSTLALHFVILYLASEYQSGRGFATGLLVPRPKVGPWTLASMGVNVAAWKVLAFVVSSALTAFGGGLWAYYLGFVSVEAFSFFLTVEYIAMVVIGGLGSVLGAILGATFVTVLPYAVDAIVNLVPVPDRVHTHLFAVKFAAFGLLMAVFLILEPRGLVSVWSRVRTYFDLWPFRYHPLKG